MSTTDRINTELTALQKELGQLKSYTDDIGKARDASEKVIDASDRFVKAFQKNTKDLVTAMEASSSAFQLTCTTSSDQLHQASKRFDADIDRSMKLLDVLGKQLDATAERVQQMTGEIRLMDLPGKFTQVREDLKALDVTIAKVHSDLGQANERMFVACAEQAKQGRIRFFIGIGFAVLNIALLAYFIWR